MESLERLWDMEWWFGGWGTAGDGGGGGDTLSQQWQNETQKGALAIPPLAKCSHISSAVS